MLFKSMPASIHQDHKISLSAIAATVVMTGFSNTVLAENLSTPKADTRDIIHVSTSPLSLENIAVAEQVDVIDAKAPEYQSATSALDLLKGQAGVFVSGSNSTYGQGIQMRGYDSRGVKVTVDNITQDFYSGLYEATFIDPTLVKKSTSIKAHHLYIMAAAR
ncbi:Outer membrane receptor for ferrienterochelin and colicins [Providencia rettgeri]|nr:Outer membrane receptor for ferrienterochelin and colicins [Providencia rettgeri]